MRMPMMVINGYVPRGYSDGLGDAATIAFPQLAVGPVASVDPSAVPLKFPEVTGAVAICIPGTDPSNPNCSSDAGLAVGAVPQAPGTVSTTGSLLFLAAAVGILFLVRA